METEMTEEKKKFKTNLDTDYSSINEGYGLGRQRWMESSNKLLKWVQEDVEGIVKPDNK